MNCPPALLIFSLAALLMDPADCDVTSPLTDRVLVRYYTLPVGPGETGPSNNNTGSRPLNASDSASTPVTATAAERAEEGISKQTAGMDEAEGTLVDELLRDENEMLEQAASKLLVSADAAANPDKNESGGEGHNLVVNIDKVVRPEKASGVNGVDAEQLENGTRENLIQRDTGPVEGGVSGEADGADAGVNPSAAAPAPRQRSVVSRVRDLIEDSVGSLRQQAATAGGSAASGPEPTHQRALSAIDRALNLITEPSQAGAPSEPTERTSQLTPGPVGGGELVAGVGRALDTLTARERAGKLSFGLNSQHNVTEREEEEKKFTVHRKGANMTLPEYGCWLAFSRPRGSGVNFSVTKQNLRADSMSRAGSAGYVHLAATIDDSFQLEYSDARNKARGAGEGLHVFGQLELDKV